MARSALTHKYVAPGLPRQVLKRPRLCSLVAQRLEHYRTVLMVGGAGSGKTVQAQMFAADAGLPLAWLTLDASDSSPSRFLTGLSISVDEFCAGGTDALHSALRSGAVEQEAAAMLAATIGSLRFLLVIDEAEVLAGHEGTMGGLATFLEYAPPTMQTLILSRDELGGPLGHRVLDDVYGLITEDNLRMTIDEAGGLLAMRGQSDVDVHAAYEMTGGWVAGLVFGSRFDMQSADHSTAFSQYLRDEVLGRLPQDEQEFLLYTSVADVVSPAVAEALIGADGPTAWLRVCRRHVPATTTAGSSMVYHSVLRSFLRSELAARHPGLEPELIRRFGHQLETAGHWELAVEQYLAANQISSAVRAAEHTLPSLYRRADWPTLTRWLDAIGDELIERQPLLLAARIRSTFGLRDFQHTISLIRRADQRGWLRAATDADSGLLATVAWALQGDAAEATRYLDKYDGDYRVEAVRFMLAATTSLTPAIPPLGSGWDDVERLVSWGLLWQGRLDELIRMVPSREESMVLNPNLILAYLWRGDAAAARATWGRVPEEISQRAHSRFIEACILHAEGDLSAALEETQAAIADSRRIRLRLDALYEVFAALLMVSLGSSQDAISVLECRLGGLAEAGDLAILELAQTVFGRALLAEGRTREAQLVLQECVRSMMTAQRRVFLPAAAIYLAEAEARLGRLDEAHEMAEVGYHAASLMGSYFWLVDALQAAPAVLERAVERDPNDSRWRRLLLTPSARGSNPTPLRTSAPSVFIDVQPFGTERDLYVNGDRAGVGRLKVVELAACLALFPNGIDRFDLQQRLFPDSDQRRGGNHFRQISHKLREVTGVSLARTRQLLTWPPGAVVDSADIRFERLLTAASAASGRDRMDRLRSALDLVPGSYLESSDLAWVEERRYHLEVVREEALLELAELLFEYGDPTEVHTAAEEILRTNPYNDEAYCQLIRVERLIGTPSSVLSVYRRAVDSLKEIGLEPGVDMKDLVRVVPAR